METATAETEAVDDLWVNENSMRAVVNKGGCAVRLGNSGPVEEDIDREMWGLEWHVQKTGRFGRPDTSVSVFLFLLKVNEGCYNLSGGACFVIYLAVQELVVVRLDGGDCFSFSLAFARDANAVLVDGFLSYRDVRGWWRSVALTLKVTCVGATAFEATAVLFEQDALSVGEGGQVLATLACDAILEARFVRREGDGGAVLFLVGAIRPELLVSDFPDLLLIAFALFVEHLACLEILVKVAEKSDLFEAACFRKLRVHTAFDDHPHVIVSEV